MGKVKVETTQEINLTKQEMDDIFRKEFGLEGDIYYSLEEAGDFDYGTYEVTGMEIRSIKKG